eukprot:scaffold4868_cov416-Prasinococcus_capsulatus_cf.AAC.38
MRCLAAVGPATVERLLLAAARASRVTASGAQVCRGLSGRPPVAAERSGTYMGVGWGRMARSVSPRTLPGSCNACLQAVVDSHGGAAQLQRGDPLPSVVALSMLTLRSVAALAAAKSGRNVGHHPLSCEGDRTHHERVSMWARGREARLRRLSPSLPEKSQSIGLQSLVDGSRLGQRATVVAQCSEEHGTDPQPSPTPSESSSPRGPEAVTLEQLQGRWLDDVGLLIEVIGDVASFSDGAEQELGVNTQGQLTLRGTVQVSVQPQQHQQQLPAADGRTS